MNKVKSKQNTKASDFTSSELAGDIAVGRRTLEEEARGLHRIADSLDSSFVAALDALQAAAGRVVVSGMGKSGNIAKKNAATLASTGTPAQYVNAAEASHGDLGMITCDDVLIALSNSGNTPELAALIDYSCKLDITLIAITGGQNSLLAKAAKIALILPQLTEACPLSLAPTTTTTGMLALGDALAVALMKRINFSSDGFNVLHPGGQLGRQFVRVKEIMHSGKSIPLVMKKDLMSKALIEMTAKSFGCVGILNEDQSLAGIITDGDLRRKMDKQLLDRFAYEVMTSGSQTIPLDMLGAKALSLMNELKITAFFVVANNNRPVGIIHIHDLLRAGGG